LSPPDLEELFGTARAYDTGRVQRAGGRVQPIHVADAAVEILELYGAAPIDGKPDGRLWLYREPWIAPALHHRRQSGAGEQARAERRAFRPYPEFQSLTGYTTDGLSNYHAFQAEVTRRFSSGLMFNFNYTWSHMLSNQDSSG
jgi:hypothetical protein